MSKINHVKQDEIPEWIYSKTIIRNYMKSLNEGKGIKMETIKAQIFMENFIQCSFADDNFMDNYLIYLMLRDCGNYHNMGGWVEKDTGRHILSMGYSSTPTGVNRDIMYCTRCSPDKKEQDTKKEETQLIMASRFCNVCDGTGREKELGIYLNKKCYMCGGSGHTSRIVTDSECHRIVLNILDLGEGINFGDERLYIRKPYVNWIDAFEPFPAT